MKRTKTTPATAGIVVVVLAVLGWIGCDGLSKMADQTADLLNQTSTSVQGDATNATQVPAVATSTPPVAPPQVTTPNTGGQFQNASTQQINPTITIGSFNIQVFGQSKLSDAGVMSYLVDIARKFDVLAIQELRSEQQNVIPTFVQMINSGGHQYGYVVGPREGYTSSKEQFVFLYNEKRIERLDDGFVARDPRAPVGTQGRMHRNPLGVTFRCRQVNATPPFTFRLLNVHTDPDETAIELEALAEIVVQLKRDSTEDDLIVLGDFNESPNSFGALANVPNLYAAIPPELKTNTLRTKCYDNIVFDRYTTTEFTNQFGVFDLVKHYNLTVDQAKQISDHMPVWAVFSIFESTDSVANQTGFGRR